MSGFADFLIGAVAGGVEGVDERIKEDDKLAREMGLEEWRLQRKQEYDRAQAEWLLKQRLSPESLEALEKENAAQASGTAKGTAAAAKSPESIEARGLLAKEALDNQTKEIENRLRTENNYANSPEGRAAFQRDLEREKLKAKTALEAEAEFYGSDDYSKSVAAKAAAELRAKMNNAQEMHTWLSKQVDTNNPDYLKNSVFEAMTGVKLESRYEAAQIKNLEENDGLTEEGRRVHASTIKRAVDTVYVNNEMTTLAALETAMEPGGTITNPATRNALKRDIDNFYATINNPTTRSIEQVTEAKAKLFKTIRRYSMPTEGEAPTIDPRIMDWVKGMDREASQIAEAFNNNGRFVPMGDMQSRMDNFKAYMATPAGTEYKGNYAYNVKEIVDAVSAPPIDEQRGLLDSPVPVEEQVPPTAANALAPRPAAASGTPPLQGVPLLQMGQPQQQSQAAPPAQAEAGLLSPSASAEAEPPVIPPTPVPAAAVDPAAATALARPDDKIEGEVFDIAQDVVSAIKQNKFKTEQEKMQYMLSLIRLAIKDGVFEADSESVYGPKIAEWIVKMSQTGAE